MKTALQIRTLVLFTSVSFLLPALAIGATSGPAASRTQCANMNHLRSGLNLGNAYSMQKYEFRKLGSAGTLKTNERSGRTNLRFPRAGVKVSLPNPTHEVFVELGTGDGDVTVTAYDSNGTVVGSFVCRTKTYQVTHTFSGAEIASLKFTCKGEEGHIDKICIPAP